MVNPSPLGRPTIPEAPGGRGAGPIFRDADASTERCKVSLSIYQLKKKKQHVYPEYL